MIRTPRRIFPLCLALAASIPLASQTSSNSSAVEIYVHGAGTRVRPNESLLLQLRAYRESKRGNGAAERTRLRIRQASFRVANDGGGRLSRPFAFPGKESESFESESQGRLAQIFGSAMQQFVNQDCVLYTAPSAPGAYVVEATHQGQIVRLTVQVDPSAPSSVPAEEVRFESAAQPDDLHYELAAHWAPMIAQEVWFQPKSDMLVRFDFDGDLHGDNNWDNLEKGSSQAFVYYAAMETATHWFLIYNFFHARDYSDRCVAGSCHENDSEGIVLTVRRDGSRFGRLEVMETLAHDNVYTYTNDSALRPGAHNIDGGIEFFEGSHPVVFVESGGHGVFGSADTKSRYKLREDRFVYDETLATATSWISLGTPSGDTLRTTTGITYIYKGVAERPPGADARRIGYALLPAFDELFVRAIDPSFRQERMFDAYRPYTPMRGRPGLAFAAEIGTSFYGRKFGVNKAKPFWGWHDARTRKLGLVAEGQWGLDPAYAISVNLSFPAGQTVSLDYTFNPYLGIARWSSNESW